jgi:hypothetical protein
LKCVVYLHYKWTLTVFYWILVYIFKSTVAFIILQRHARILIEIFSINLQKLQNFNFICNMINLFHLNNIFFFYYFQSAQSFFDCIECFYNLSKVPQSNYLMNLKIFYSWFGPYVKIDIWLSDLWNIFISLWSMLIYILYFIVIIYIWHEIVLWENIVFSDFFFFFALLQIFTVNDSWNVIWLWQVVSVLHQHII